MSTVVILGATSAIAEQFARLYACAGNHLILVARNMPALEEVKQDLISRGTDQVDCLEHDFSISENTAELRARVEGMSGDIDILLLTYGTLPDQDKCTSDLDYTKREFELNGLNPILTISAFSEHFKKRKRGTIAAISSVAGDRGRQSNYLYGSAKAALSVYLSGLRNTLSEYNVQVLTIKPGFVDTPMTKDFKKGLLWVKPEKVAKDIKKAIDKKKNILYTPWFWQWIMLIIKHIPEFIFKKLKL